MNFIRSLPGYVGRLLFGKDSLPRRHSRSHPRRESSEVLLSEAIAGLSAELGQMKRDVSEELLRTRQQLQTFDRGGLQFKRAVDDVSRKLSVLSAQSAQMERFNTAIFYDVENLTKGYRFSHDFVAKISLKDIIQRLSETELLGKISVQRAYANWADSRMKALRNEIVDLGIEPVQIFGFGHGPQKNAADIQLAIDVMECIHLRPSIEVFAIVSGDGAFAALAKKLHEYGKTVIGCAYEAQTNRVLASVCDAFVQIPDPERSVREEGDREATESGTATSDILTRVREVLPALKQDIRMIRGGIVLPQIRLFLIENIQDFEKIYAQYVDALPDKRLTPFLRTVCEDTEFAVDETHPAKLVLRDATSDAQESVHSVDRYRQILLSGYRKFKLEAPEDVQLVARYLASESIDGETLTDYARKLTDMMGDRLSQEAVLNCLLAFLSADCFEIEEDSGPPWKWRCTLKSSFHSPEEVIQALRDGIRSRLREFLLDIDEDIEEDVLAEILP